MICCILVNSFIIYFLLSFFEWYIHKNLMHDTNKNLFINFINNIYFKYYKKYLSTQHSTHHNNNNIDGTIINDIGTRFDSTDKYILSLFLILPYYLITKPIYNFFLINFIV